MPLGALVSISLCLVAQDRRGRRMENDRAVAAVNSVRSREAGSAGEAGREFVVVTKRNVELGMDAWMAGNGDGDMASLSIAHARIFG